MQTEQSRESPAGSTLPRVIVQVLHWRGIDKTRQCLKSLEAIDYPNFGILLVDNGSDASDHKILKSEFEHIEVLALDQNYGFAGGSNHGLKHAMQAGADFVWLINNDATVEPETLTLLVNTAAANPDAGALGVPVAEGMEYNPAQIGAGKIDYFKAKTYLQKAPVGLSGASGGLRCQWLSGSSLLLKTRALEKSGLFDERYYLYFEDVDLCLRLGRAGFNCLLVPGSVVHHQGNASTQGGLSLWRAYYHTRNRLLFFMQHAPPTARAVAFLSILAHFLRHCLSLPLKGKAGRAKLYAEWLGTRDFFSGKLGRAKCLDWCETISL